MISNSQNSRQENYLITQIWVEPMSKRACEVSKRFPVSSKVDYELL